MNHIRTLTVASLTCILCACSGNSVKETLGLDRKPPDEFRVVSRPPLSVPPDFALNPPSASATSPTSPSTEQQAHSLLTGSKPDDQGSNTFALKQPTADAAQTNAEPVKQTDSKPLTGTAAAESQFLKDAGADKADPTVRNKLIEEKVTEQEKHEEKESSWWNIFDLSSDKEQPVVDATKEAQRIKQDEAQGQPVTTGDTPNVQQKNTGFLGRIFGY